MASAVHLRRTVALLGRFPALTGADLDVDGGEVVHLSGPNGAGKTTLLRVCAGLVPVVDGEATVLGHDLTRDHRRHRRLVGLLGHETFLYEDLTVAENVRFAVRAAAGDATAVDVALGRVGINDRVRDVPAARLSAGQRRRAALAVLVARSPRLWLLDEPHAGLDAHARDLVDELISEAAARGAAVVFASHDIDRALAIATRTATVVGGQVHVTQPYRPPSEVLADAGGPHA